MMRLVYVISLQVVGLICLSAAQPSSSSNTAEIPSRIADRVLVAMGEQIRMKTIHVYDLGIYLSETSSLWGTNVTRGGLIQEAVACTLRYEVTCQYVTSELLSEAIADDVKGRVSAIEFADIDGVFAPMMQKGPFSGVGSVIYLELYHDGVRIIVNGQDMGKVMSSALAKAVFSIYFDENAEQQDFVAATLQRISDGLPPADWKPTLLVDEDAARLRMWLWVGLAVLIFGSVICCSCIVWLCCTRRISGPRSYWKMLSRSSSKLEISPTSV
eukprot:TRINITY_DN28130_c0_g1_i1.p1 TRINITY_DN28130_c0_g1~~TRINITY_DN28130_c0_g1_i1.p1  ORF type:complete len:271 (+),score=41.01 TRINITY_DN28130_c0_g1_i1:70-882(+)